MNGRPDLSGLWEADATPRSELVARLGAGFFELQIDVPKLSKYVVNLLWDIKSEDDPSRPEAIALMKERSLGKEFLPGSSCLPNSIPFTPLILPFKIVQTPVQMVMLYEHYDPPRQVYIDGRTLPKDLDPTWMGYAAGKWQGDTLVVESAGFNGQTWLDGAGHPRSESARMTERYRRRDFGHMEAVCAENEKDRIHVVK